jgi:hypothetical protein
LISGLWLVAFPLHITYAAPALSNSDRFGGENVIHTSFTLVEFEGRWAAGFLYLTNFRMLWTPARFFFAVDTGLLPLSIRLNQVRNWAVVDSILKAPRLRVWTHSEEFDFTFVAHFIPVISFGDPRGHLAWKEALEKTLPRETMTTQCDA